METLDRFYPKRLERYYGLGHLHFITCSCYQRLPLLGSAHSKNVFVNILGQVRDRYRFALVGYVVMPEHIHLLISEPAKGTPSTILQVLKQQVSRQLRHRWLEPVGVPHPLHGLKGWGRLQPRFHDFNVWSHKKKIEKLDYMHNNPVKRGLVLHPRDWPWSSFSFYNQKGQSLIGIDPV